MPGVAVVNKGNNFITRCQTSAWLSPFLQETCCPFVGGGEVVVLHVRLCVK